MILNYGDLVVWQKAMDFGEVGFHATPIVPKHQHYVLASQLQHSILSVPSSIAKSRSRHSANDFTYHLNIARGSFAEAKTQLLLSQRLLFINEITTQKLLFLSEKITKMIFGLRSRLQPYKKLKPSAKNYNLTPKT